MKEKEKEEEKEKEDEVQVEVTLAKEESFYRKTGTATTTLQEELLPPVCVSSTMFI